MFNGCRKLRSLDLSNFDLSGVRDLIGYDFFLRSCVSLDRLTLGEKTKLYDDGYWSCNLSGYWELEGSGRDMSTTDLMRTYGSRAKAEALSRIHSIAFTDPQHRFPGQTKALAWTHKYLRMACLRDTIYMYKYV